MWLNWVLLSASLSSLSPRYGFVLDQFKAWVWYEVHSNTECDYDHIPEASREGTCLARSNFLLPIDVILQALALSLAVAASTLLSIVVGGDSFPSRVALYGLSVFGLLLPR